MGSAEKAKYGEEIELSSRFVTRLHEEVQTRRNPSDPERISHHTLQLLRQCSRLFSGISTINLGIYYLGEEDSEAQDFLRNARAHFQRMEDLLGSDRERFLKRELFYKQRIPDTPYSLVVRRGFLENNWGLEFTIGTEDANWQRTEKLEEGKDLARIGINFDGDSVRIVNIEGVEDAQRFINKEMPKILKHRPLNSLILLISMWAKEQGFAKVKGIKSSHQKYLQRKKQETGRSLPYEEILEAVGFEEAEGSWFELDTDRFYEKALARLTPAQNDGFNNLSTAFGNLEALNRNGERVHSKNPFYLRNDMATIGPAMITTRYAIEKHTPGIGALTMKMAR
jgi:hypothetical protein